jgi:NADH-quinone oxidoreductase subunit L
MSMYTVLAAGSEEAVEHSSSAPWILAHAWLLPAIMVAAFVLTLFFGKKMKFRGAEFGVIGIGATFVLSIGAVLQWVRLAPGAGHSEEGAKEEALRIAGAGMRSFAAQFAGGEPIKLRDPIERSVSWFRDGNVDIGLGIHIDGFAVAMLFTVAFISLCVHIFSIEYLRDDARFTHYFASLNLFTAAMLWMVQTSTTLGLLFGWELMGLCSFLLIGHWWEEKNNTDAALKAFFTTRTGDIGLLIGIVILFFAAGNTFDMAAINEKALSGTMSHTLLVVAAVALFFGVMGKSAQFPLHTWLPDAMAGPTPASSLIHAATMVVAGVYLFGRLYGVFWQGFSINYGGMNFGSWIGAITVVSAAGLAFVQTDIKKVLAYSTVSQLGYMILGLSVGAWVGAIFHLVTHAFFKALLFQASGSIAHSGSHHSFEMERMGGLRKYMPITYRTFFVGYLALAGVPIFSGFWSKDEILNAADKNGFTLAFIAGSLGAFMTGCYMTRVMAKTFWGENRLHLFHDDHDTHGSHDTHAAHDDHAHDAHAAHDDHAHAAHDDGHGDHDGPHESPALITGPLIALAVMATFIGFANWPFKDFLFLKKFWFEKNIANITFEETVAAAGKVHPFDWGVAGPSIFLAVAGIAVGYWYNVIKKGDLGLVRRGGPFALGHKVLKNKYYLDVLWTDVIVGSIKGPIAKMAYWFNQNILDAVINGAGRSATATGRGVYKFIDQGLVDGVVNGAGLTASTTGGVLRKLQNGKVQAYAGTFLAATGLIGFGLVLFL